MKKVLTLTTILILTLSLNARNLSGNSLFSDHKARRVGDLLTVLITDNAQASNEAKTSTGTASKIGAASKATGVLDFLPEVGLDGSLSNNYSGSGKTERKGSLRANLAVQIVEIMPNGNLLIEGNKVVEVNGEKQLTKLTGQIRSQDIMGNNSVNSNNVLNLQITYTGDGVTADAEKPGLISRFFNWLF